MNVYTTMESPVGELLLVGRPSPGGVTLTSVSMAGQRFAPAVRDGWRRDPAAFAEVTRQLTEYFAGERRVLPRSGPARHRIPAAGLAGAGFGPVRHDDHLWPAGRPARRPARPDPGAGRRDRGQPAGHHPLVSPGHRLGRRYAGLHRRRGTQAAVARARGRAPGGLMVITADWQAC